MVYAPASNLSGASRSTFSFTVNDAETGTVSAAMNINVTAVNDVPQLSQQCDNKRRYCDDLHSIGLPVH